MCSNYLLLSIIPLFSKTILCSAFHISLTRTSRECFGGISELIDFLTDKNIVISKAIIWLLVLIARNGFSSLPVKLYGLGNISLISLFLHFFFNIVGSIGALNHCDCANLEESTKLYFMPYRPSCTLCHIESYQKGNPKWI